MKIILSVILSIALLSINSTNVYCHDPNEITYEFKEDKLTIYFTQKSALDIIISLDPDNAQQEVFLLSDYACILEDYFNSKIRIISNNSKIYLNYYSSDLIHHEAFIEFNLTSSLNGTFQPTVETNAFHEIYPKVNEQIYINGTRIE